MKLPHRRQFLHLAAGAAALPAVSSIARAQGYPTRPVRIVVPYAAGSSPDIIARLIGQWLSERLGQQVIIENRPGAGGNIGTEVVVRAPADGYTLLLATGANGTNAALYEKLNFDFIRDIAPVAALGGVALVMVINPSFPAKTVAEFIAYAKANPGKINIASAGSGTTVHLAAELFKIMTDVDFALVQYRGNAWTDLISGQVQGIFGVIPASQEYIKTGKVRALAVTGATRSEVLPHVPTMGEFVPRYEASSWYGVGAPKGTPAEIIEKLNKDINAGKKTDRKAFTVCPLRMACPVQPDAGDSVERARLRSSPDCQAEDALFAARPLQAQHLVLGAQLCAVAATT
jgi:tripartite-type tricarboxylate transporter receptor subunit TctC